MDAKQTYSAVPYPFVVCDQHGGGPPMPGYVTCLHVASGGARIAMHDEPTSEEAGHALCAACARTWPQADAVDELLIACAACIGPHLAGRVD